MLKLRPYQEDLINGVRESLVKYKRSLLVAPTGAGKTALTVHMMQTASERGKRCMFLIHRNELLKQTSAAMWAQHLEHGQIKSGRISSKQPVLVASVGTLVNRLPSVEAPDLIIIDEAHRSTANSYKKILEAYPNAFVVGLTATPERTDGKGLGDVYNDLVSVVDVRELIDMGFLCDYSLLAPPSQVDVSSVHTTAGDYNKKELAEVTDKPKITGDAIDHYVKYANGKTCIVFCVTIEHAKHVCDMYKSAGIECEQLDGGHTEKERTETLERFNNGQTKVLTSVDLFLEGLDIPKIEVVQWLRKTKSMIVWRQGVGRGLRPAPGKEKLIILDHVGNSLDPALGLPCSEYEWSLQGSKGKGKKKKDDITAKQCPSCYTVYNAKLRQCPSCGEVVEVKQREILQEDGELTEVDKTAIRMQGKREQAGARELDQLVALGVKRGMKSPDGWAANIYAARLGHKPTAELRALAAKILRGLK
jgi:superfamily II DNA or RNA helicase